MHAICRIINAAFCQTESSFGSSYTVGAYLLQGSIFLLLKKYLFLVATLYIKEKQI